MKVVILGAGESGLGAAILAKHNRHSVFVSEKGSIKTPYKEELEKHGIPYEEAQHTMSTIESADIIIKSPGIPDEIPMIKKLVSKGIPVISEIEYAGRYTDGFIIGITGSNGKTTTTKLTYHLMKQAGLDVAMVGNVGTSFARSLAEGKHQYYVLELSSFQLDGVYDFRPDVSMLLNITPDHLDRYAYKMERYIAAKFRIARSQQPDDVFIYNADDENISSYLAHHPVGPQAIPVHMSEMDIDGIKVDGHYFHLKGSRLIGTHNYMNALFAVRAARMCGADDDAIQKGLMSFTPVEHRMELIGSIGDVTFINDSKATNVDAAYFALDAMEKPIVWVAGGQDKGNDYSSLLPLIEQKARVMICLGLENEKLIDTFGHLVEDVYETKTAEEAVEKAIQYAKAGEVVLLSPACASFDLFDNYEQRGRLFKEAVLRRIQ
jgi:UDP-N-acetylmuramoylalanine--D-glutamate ligase